MAVRIKKERVVIHMKKVAVVYWSGTGNTEKMAESVVKGAKDKGAEVQLITASEFDASTFLSWDAVAFGCPAMGNEELEDSEFQPMWEQCLPKLGGRTIALFGSYEWAEGEWMRTWTKDCEDAGAVLACESVTCYDVPDEAGLAACEALGAALAG